MIAAVRIPLSLQQLHAMTRLARLGSFRDAAIEIGMSQPGLSRTVQAIEARLDARIFDRDTHRVALTPAGEYLLPLAENLLAEYEDAFRRFDAFVAGDTGLVRIAALPSAAAVVLPPVIAEVARRSPGVRVEVMEAIGEPVWRAVKEGFADVGIAPPAHDEDLRYSELLKEDVVLICRRDDPLADAPDHHWDVFTHRPFVALATDTVLRHMSDEAFAHNSITITPALSCRQPSTLAAFVAAGMGIAALPWLAARQFTGDELVSRPLVDPVATRSIGLVTHSRRSPSPAAKLLIRNLRTAARNLARHQASGVRAR